MMRIPRMAIALPIILVIFAGEVLADKKPAKRTDRIRVYNTKMTQKSYQYPEVKKTWEDISPTKYDVWYQPYQKASLDYHTAIVVDAYINDPKMPFPAAGRRGVRVAFPAQDDGPFVFACVKDTKRGSGKPSWGCLGEVYLVTPWGPYKQLDGKIKPKWRMWLAGTYTKEFKYKLVKADDGRDKLIVHHTTGTRWHSSERRMVIWEMVLGDWFATVRFPAKSDVQWIGSHRHERIVAIPGKGEKGKDIVLDAKYEEKGKTPFPTDGEKHLRVPINPATQKRYALIHRLGFNTSWDRPQKRVAYLPFIWWEKTGSGKLWGYTSGKRYQCIGREDAQSVGLIRVGGLPIYQGDMLRLNTRISKTLPPGRYRRMGLVGMKWKLDRIIEVTDKNLGKDIPAKVTGSEFLYLVDDLEERCFKPTVSAREKLKVAPAADDDRWVVQTGVMILKDVKAGPPSKPIPTSDATAPKHWNYYRGGGSAAWGRTTKEAHSGKFSVFMTLLGRGDVNVALMAGDSDGYTGEKAAPAKPSAKYKYSFWAKGDIGNFRFNLVAWKTDEAKSADRVYPRLLTFTPTSEWKKYEGEFTMPAEAKKFVFMFQRYGRISADMPLGTVYIDDLSVQTDKVEVIKNGGAENK